MSCLVGCAIDECGRKFCRACSVDHSHRPRPATTRLEPDRYLLPEVEEQQGVAEGVAELSEAGQERAKPALPWLLLQGRKPLRRSGLPV
eukprot:3481240-Alexandrium_andersonii.AAC.2